MTSPLPAPLDNRAVARVLEDTYVKLREEDPRWSAPWGEVELMLNPNGPMVEGGSDGDNGQTGRKLAMDFYGPRIPIGGGQHVRHGAAQCRFQFRSLAAA